MLDPSPPQKMHIRDSLFNTHTPSITQGKHPSRDDPTSRDTGSSSKAGGPGLPAPEKGLFPESRILALMAWRQVQRTGPGLYNLGNTCFLNATLQCLAYLPPLAQLLLASEHCASNNSKGPGQGGLGRGGFAPGAFGFGFGGCLSICILPDKTNGTHTYITSTLQQNSHQVAATGTRCSGRCWLTCTGATRAGAGAGGSSGRCC